MFNKKIITGVALLISAMEVNAQETIIKAGTPVLLAATQSVYAKDVDEGQMVNFVVTANVKSDNKIVIPQGTGKVTLAKKSSLAGRKGKLKISVSQIILPSGQQIYLDGNEISLSGKE